MCPYSELFYLNVRSTNDNDIFSISRTIDNVINSLCHSLGDNLKIETSHPYGSTTVLKITLGKILKGMVVFKRLQFECVVVKGPNEDLLNEDGKIDMWGESRYKVFRKISENANAALFHFYLLAFPELRAISYFLVSKHSLIKCISKRL